MNAVVPKPDTAPIRELSCDTREDVLRYEATLTDVVKAALKLGQDNVTSCQVSEYSLVDNENCPQGMGGAKVYFIGYRENNPNRVEALFKSCVVKDGNLIEAR